MKLSELFENNFWGAYIIGTIYAFQYKLKNNFISLFSARNQKSTNHKVNIKIFYDQLLRVEKFYDIELKKIYCTISNSIELPNRIKNTQIGLYSVVINDIEEEIDDKIFEKLNNKNKNFVINLIRGIIDARSSGDKTANYISMDIKKSFSVSFSVILDKAFKIIFGENNIKYNINPRFNQPTKKSRMKNPQFRIPYQIVFGDIGTFRIFFLEKVKENRYVWKKLLNNTDIPNHFDSIIQWDTSNLPYKPKSINNIKVLKGDLEYLNNYSSGKEELLYSKLKEKYSSSYDLHNKKRKKFKIETIYEIINKYKCKDFLEPEKKIENNKRGDPLIDIHHIIPYRYNYLFENKTSIDNINNLVPLRPDTHYFLHRGAFNEKKINYLNILYKKIQSFLAEQNLLNKIDFLTFKNMY